MSLKVADGSLVHSQIKGDSSETSPPTVGERDVPMPTTYYAIPIILLAMGVVIWWLLSRKPGR